MTKVKLTTPLRYESDHDVAMRLDQTFVRYQGGIYWCRAYDNLKVQLFKNHSGEAHVVVHSSDEDLDLSPIRIGFLSRVSNYPIYISRAPVRKYKQGISAANLTSTYIKGGQIGTSGIGSVRFTDAWYKTLNNDYVSWNDALKEFKRVMNNGDDSFSVPISYDFCIYKAYNSKDLVLIDSSFDTVGVINQTTKVLTVNGWWATPTMLELLQSLGVPLNE